MADRVYGTDTPQPQIPRETQLLALAITWEDAVRTGKARSYAEIARRHGVSRAWVSRILGQLDLWPAPAKPAFPDPLHES